MINATCSQLHATNARLSAAICMTAGLQSDILEAGFSEETLDAATSPEYQGMGLQELVLCAAKHTGRFDRTCSHLSIEAWQTALGMHGGYSVVNLPAVLGDVGQKFLRQGWDAADKTPLRLAAIRPVNDFKEITTVSLVGETTFQQVGPTGEIKHGKLGEETYSNKADTYARMLTITRADFINDDLGALTGAAKKLGRGAALKLNEIFWTKFLDNGAFFTSGRNNVSTDTGELGLVGLQQADDIFMQQTDPDGEVLGIEPQILLVPTQLRATANVLVNSEKVKGETDEPDGNPFKDRFRVESSPHMSNPKYTGHSPSAWYLLADPEELPVIEIAALNGRVEPVIETADAAFSYMGVAMRGYSDVGVELQEHRGSVRADGSAAG